MRVEDITWDEMMRIAKWSVNLLIKHLGGIAVFVNLLEVVQVAGSSIPDFWVRRII